MLGALLWCGLHDGLLVVFVLVGGLLREQNASPFSPQDFIHLMQSIRDGIVCHEIGAPSRSGCCSTFSLRALLSRYAASPLGDRKSSCAACINMSM